MDHSKEEVERRRTTQYHTILIIGMMVKTQIEIMQN